LSPPPPSPSPCVDDTSTTCQKEKCKGYKKKKKDKCKKTCGKCDGTAAVDSSLTVVGESTGYDGVAALLIAALLIAIPLVGTMYVAARHGAGKVPLWFKLHFSHSNPKVVWFYLSAEERTSMRQRLCGDKGGSLATTEPTADENFGPSRRPGILLPTPAAGSTPAAITTAQKWLAQAEDAAASGSSC